VNPEALDGPQVTNSNRNTLPFTGALHYEVPAAVPDVRSKIGSKKQPKCCGVVVRPLPASYRIESFGPEIKYCVWKR
jgi:hypothetical protein